MEIITITGPLCSGKNYYSQKINVDSKIIDVGDIVREITNDESRTFDKSLDTLIIERLEKEIKQSAVPGLIIIGMRQLSIFQAIEKLSKQFSIKMTNFVLDVDEDVRKARYIERNAAKDTYLSFDFADIHDQGLGLVELIAHLKSRRTTRIVRNQ